MNTRIAPKHPPRLQNYEGKPRRVGIELEFAAVRADRAAARIKALFGGEIHHEDAHRSRVEGTRFGDFVTELDTRYAHRPADEPSPAPGSLQEFLSRARDTMRELYGEVGSLVIPYEVVCPPVAIDDIVHLDDLLDALRAEGARGTRQNLLHAFGAQLNPDIATDDPGWILSVLKAQVLLSEWLRAVMNLDTSRQLFAFSEPFPDSYAFKILKPDYWPDRDRLISDYLEANPTRNRELDMLPLFAWFDEEKVRDHVPDGLIKKRPTFHYRLPDANISQPDWCLALEWNRWVVIERLADNREALAEMGLAFIENENRIMPEDWAMQCTEWLTGVR